MNDIVVILMAVYNGEKFIYEQIQSIRSQNYKTWELWIRDDGSSDNTVNVINKAISEEPRIRLIEDKSCYRGAKNNFSILMKHALTSDADFFCFADQDDFWLPDKLSKEVKLLKENTERDVEPRPILVYSDITVVGEELESIAVSGMKYHKMCHPESDPLGVLLARNVVTGCTIMFNRSLLELSYPVPEHALMHDWWLALCASTYGDIVFCEKPLVLYRQHSGNEVGAKGLYVLLNPFKSNWLKNWSKGSEFFLQSFKQAELILEIKTHFKSDENNLRRIKEYSFLLNRSRFERVSTIFRLKIHRQNFALNLLFYLRLLTL